MMSYHVFPEFILILCFFFFRLSTNEILDLIGEGNSDLSDLSDDDSYNVVIMPPEEDGFAASDEDSDGSVGEAEGMIEDLPRRILRSTGEINSKKDSPKSHESIDALLPDNSVASGSSCNVPKKKKKLRHWLQQIPNFLISTPVEREEDKNDITSPLDYFRKFFSVDLVDHIVQQTNLYSKQHGRNVEVSKEEMLGIIGVMILSGYHPVFDKKLLWSSDDDVSVEWVKELMSRNRFIAIIRDIHLADNCNLDSSDLYYKIRSYFEHLNKSFKEAIPLDQNLSVDESVVPYYGRHRTKQFIRGKSIREAIFIRISVPRRTILWYLD